MVSLFFPCGVPFCERVLWYLCPKFLPHTLALPLDEKKGDFAPLSSQDRHTRISFSIFVPNFPLSQKNSCPAEKTVGLLPLFLWPLGPPLPPPLPSSSSLYHCSFLERGSKVGTNGSELMTPSDFPPFLFSLFFPGKLRHASFGFPPLP